eukprot:3041449-Rhodomonas_salina.3
MARRVACSDATIAPQLLASVGIVRRRVHWKSDSTPNPGFLKLLRHTPKHFKLRIKLIDFVWRGKSSYHGCIAVPPRNAQYCTGNTCTERAALEWYRLLLCTAGFTPVKDRYCVEGLGAKLWYRSEGDWYCAGFVYKGRCTGSHVCWYRRKTESCKGVLGGCPK